MKGFILKLGSTSPAPGGGAAAGISLSMAGACAEKAVRFSEKQLDHKTFVNILDTFCTIRDAGLKLHKNDQEAFMAWSNARKLPKQTEEERNKRTSTIDKYVKACITTPFNIYKESVRLMNAIEEFLPSCDKWLVSDVAVATSLCGAALESSYYNILVNSPFLKDKEYLKQIDEFVGGSMPSFLDKKEALSRKCIEMLQD